MATRIRLQRHGRKKRPFYHIVIADQRAPRDGKFIEKIGTYDPNTVPATINIDRDRAFDWIMNGAQPTDTVRAILRYNGVLYRKHLQRGVRKGAFSQEEADKRYQDWLDAKASKIAGRKDALAAAAAEEQAKRDAAEREKNLARYGTEEAEAPAEEEASTEEVVEEANAVVEEAPAAEPVEAPAPEPVEEPSPEPEPEPVAEAPAEEVKPDDLTKVEGIGPKISSLLIEAGYKTFADLAKAETEAIKQILVDNSLQQHVPDTWPKQAELAAEGKWEELEKWQDELDGGKEVE